jgi:hypothetical protein
MPWWFKCQPKLQRYPVAYGPYDTQERAELEQSRWLESPEGDAENPGEIFQAEKNYHKTLVYSEGYQMFEGAWHLRYSDGTLEPVS